MQDELSHCPTMVGQLKQERWKESKVQTRPPGKPPALLPTGPRHLLWCRDPESIQQGSAITKRMTRRVQRCLHDSCPSRTTSPSHLKMTLRT
jgi:hypothetical protein